MLRARRFRTLHADHHIPLQLSRTRPGFFLLRPFSVLHWQSSLFVRNAIFENSRALRVPVFKRTLSFDAIPSVLIPPLVYFGLFLTLWAYKCFMMVVFQNKIIYMPYVPPFARSERIEDYVKLCKPVVWKERRIKSEDGTDIALCVGRVARPLNAQSDQVNGTGRHVITLYFQGNASSLPPRLPGLSNILKSVSARTVDDGVAESHSFIALSYRGYWKSHGRPSQRGIEKDAIALMEWLNQAYGQLETPPRLILWGQSIGAGVATWTIAEYLHRCGGRSSKHLSIDGLVLETPFVSVRDMLSALYPQKWLPYRYLWPFLRNWWDSADALRKIAPLGRFPTLIISAEKDEVVPSSQGSQLLALFRELGMDVVFVNVAGSLHNEATIRQQGRQALTQFISRTGEKVSH